jgi:peptide/nickel transport system substrate-binding protein
VDRTGTYGGALVYSALGEMETFNPVEPKGATGQVLRQLAFNGLLEYNNGTWKYEMGLAERYEVSGDHLVWTFYLRDGLKWSDGEPLTIDDVEFSFLAVFDERFPNSIRDGFRDVDGNLPDMEVLRDQRAIRFTRAHVDSQFLTHVGGVLMIPRHKWQASFDDGTLLQQMTNDMDPKDLVGTGPFVLKEYVPAQKIEYTRNPYYWQADARGERLPYVDRVVILLLKDQNLEWQKFESGELHLINTISADHYKEAVALEDKGNGPARLCRLGTSLNTNWLAWNLHPGSDLDTGKPFVDPEKLHWFSNLTFRQAMNHAIDRGGIVKSAFQGRGVPIWTSFTPGNKLWHNPDVPQYPHDTERANALLDELGWTDRDGDGVREDDTGAPIRFSMMTNVENNVRQQVGTLIQAALKDVGVQVDFKPISFNDLVTSLRDSHAWDTMILGWGSGVPPDPSNGKNITTSSGRLHVWYPQQPEPATPWEARIDELMAKMDSELEYEVRKTYNDEIQALVAENIPIFYLVASNSYAGASRNIGNLWPSLLRPEVTWNLDELYLKEAPQANPS